MIAHFLRRDFLDYRLYWGITAAVTALCVLGLIAPDVLFLVYFLLAVVPQSSILGSVWRSQHALSRHYLLALPMRHRVLFGVQHVRILAFYLPLILLVAGAPHWLDLAEGFSARTWLLYYLGLAGSLGLFIEYVIWSTLEMERISRYVPQGSLLWAYVKVFAAPFAFFFLLLQPAWTNLLLTSIQPDLHAALTSGPFSWLSVAYRVAAPEVVFPIGAAIMPLLIVLNARKWCVTL